MTLPYAQLDMILVLPAKFGVNLARGIEDEEQPKKVRTDDILFWQNFMFTVTGRMGTYCVCRELVLGYSFGSFKYLRWFLRNGTIFWMG